MGAISEHELMKPHALHNASHLDVLAPVSHHDPLWHSEAFLWIFN
jgi:hypothetical protein